MNKKLISLGVLLFGLYLSGNAANIALVPQTGQTSTLPLAAPTNSDGNLRKGAAWPSTRFVADPSGDCITDNLTGLMWVKNLSTVYGGANLDWNTALSIADSGTWCGYTDWRMPNINELRSLVNYGYPKPANWLMYGSGTNLATAACSGVCFVNVITANYWTSSSSASNPTANAWNVSMSSAATSASNDKTLNNTSRLFPVRGGQ